MIQARGTPPTAPKRRRSPVGSSRNLPSSSTTRLKGPEWLHEIKFDGYRMHARLDRSVLRLLTRTGLD